MRLIERAMLWMWTAIRDGAFIALCHAQRRREVLLGQPVGFYAVIRWHEDELTEAYSEPVESSLPN